MGSWPRPTARQLPPLQQAAYNIRSSSPPPVHLEDRLEDAIHVLRNHAESDSAKVLPPTAACSDLPGGAVEEAVGSRPSTNGWRSMSASGLTGSCYESAQRLPGQL